MSAPLGRIQQHLEAIYAIDIAHRVEDFVIGDDQLEAFVRAGVVPEELARTEEQVLVLSEDGAVQIAVYLSDRVRRGLTTGASLQEHCHATEGVSHFVMLLWSARQERPVRALDLELQAEIDKVSTVLLLDRDATGGARTPQLLSRLFDSAELDPELSEVERHRYREAHRLAARYSRRLVSLLDVGVGALLQELRTLYRLPPEAKRARVARAA